LNLPVNIKGRINIMSNSYEVITLNKNNSEDVTNFPELISFIIDDEEIFIINDETNEWWIASEFFYTYDIKSFIRMDQK